MLYLLCQTDCMAYYNGLYLMYVNNKCCFEIHLNFINVQFDVVTIRFYSIIMNIDAIKDIERKIGLYLLGKIF